MESGLNEGELYRNLFDMTPLGLLLINAENRIRDVNSIFLSLFDILETDRILGVRIEDYAPFHELGMPENLERCRELAHPVVTEGECLTAAGQSIIVRYYLVPLTAESGIPGGVQVFVKNLTVIRDTEERLRRLFRYFNNIVAGISPLFTMNPTLQIQFANPAFCRDFSIDLEEIEGRDIFDVIDLNNRDRRIFLAAIAESDTAEVHHREFDHLGRIFGYTIFHLEEEIGVILRDISRQKQLESKVKLLYSRLLNYQDQERRRLAGDLHDSVGQTILAAKLNLNAYEDNPEREGERFATGLELIDRASQELREIYSKLYPSTLRDLGLAAAVRWYAKNFLRLKSIQTELEIELEIDLDPETEMNLFRIVQEIFTNIVKHSEASRVELLLRADESGIRLEVDDNGVGFDPEKTRSQDQGFGLENIRSRVDYLGGILEIRSAVGEGSRFRIKLPPPPDSGG